MNIRGDVLAQLKEAVGRRGFSDDPAEIAPHLEEWRGRYHGRSPLLLKPAAVDEVSRLLAICNEARVAVVPQGGNTGLVGGQIPFAGEVLLSLQRMNAVRRVDAAGFDMTVEAGTILQNAQTAADEAGMLFPLSLASEGSCTIGGNLSTNAGGVNVLRYGSARDLVLGLEVVLADGRVLDLLRTLRKDNTGYDLKSLFLGSEGTLGVITAAALKLFARPRVRVTAFAAVESPGAAVALLARMQAATGGLVSSFELMPCIALDLVLRHIPGAREPLAAKSPWYVLCEVSGGSESLTDTVQGTLADLPDAALAQNEVQRAALWALRENVSEAQKREGASLKHDVAVPVADVPAFMEAGVAAVTKIVPGARAVSFGHLGDGNIHFNFSVPEGGDGAAFLAHGDEIAHAVHDIVHGFGGSISAEHGVGVLKREEIVRYKSAVEMDLMRTLKRTLDPNGILNPGKVV